MNKLIMLILTLLGLAIWTPSVFAFQILTPKSDPCHERITLGALDAIPAPFGSPADTSLSTEIQSFVTRANTDGIPSDKATRALIKEVTSRFNLSGFSLAERYIFMSFVVGNRFPDTNGFAVIKSNETRTIHIKDENQARHSLRRASDDHEQGSINAIDNAIREITNNLQIAHTGWNSSAKLITSTKWTFPFYGELYVKVFTPAFLLGQMAHTIQDSYSHAIRDDSLNILSVMNFVDVILSNHNESRDGPGHSERMDQCNIRSNSFDAMRVEAARSDTADLIAQSVSVLSNPTYDNSPVMSLLNTTYSFQGGCNTSNNYCDSAWYTESQKEVTEPFDISGCGLFRGSVSSHDTPSPPWIIYASILFVLFLWAFLKWLSAKSKPRYT